MRLFFFLMIRRPPRSTLFPYAPLSRSLSYSGGGEEPNQRPKSPRQRSSEGKIGRNDPCPCGSGKKYKKCGIPNTPEHQRDRKSTRLNSSHANISYAVFCLKKTRKRGLP